MNKGRRIKLGQDGVTAIFITMIVLTGIFFVTFAVNTIVMNGISMNRAHLNSTKAYFAAESGTEWVLWRIRKQYNTAINPISEWDSGTCFQLPGNGNDMPKCYLDCESAIENLLYQDLANGSKYRIRYDLDDTGATDVAIFSTTGIYQDITKRVVEVSYQF